MQEDRASNRGANAAMRRIHSPPQQLQRMAVCFHTSQVGWEWESWDTVGVVLVL